MIKSNIFLSALGLLAILILPIYPNSGTLDFGGNVDASIVYLLTLFITGISRSKIFLGIIIFTPNIFIILEKFKRLKKYLIPL